MSEGESQLIVQSVKSVYDRLFKSGQSLSKIKDAALECKLFATPVDSLRVPGRSLAWKLFLTSREPLLPSTESNLSPDLSSLRMSRKRFSNLLLEKMRAPDGSYEEGFTVPDMDTPPKREDPQYDLETNNPLSLHTENPWTEYFASVELRKTILQDVERTFPDFPYFREPQVQRQLTNILFLYSVTNASVGYRQGMHELLAPLYQAVDYDSIPQGIDTQNLDPAMVESCSQVWVTADAWALFEAVMRGVSRWYEWREPPVTQSPGVSPLHSHVQLHVSSERSEPRPYVAPIVETCNRIQSTLLRSVDPLLYKKMLAASIEPQIYGIRWLRMLFTREFNMQDSLILWDGLFACDPTFELAPWICVAMLIRVRSQLIPSDYTGQLAHLLRYPHIDISPPDVGKGSIHHASLLVRQAIALETAPTPFTGTSVMMENRNLLNIATDIPNSTPTRRGSQVPKDGPSSASLPRSGGYDRSGTPPSHTRQQSSQQLGLPEMIARGLLERGESLGINKTLMNAVTELRRNIPDIAASLVRTPAMSSTSSSLPMTDERPPGERPPWEPRTRFEMEREITGLRDTNKKLGKTVGWIVDALLLDESAANGSQDLASIKIRKREALECLSYVRDVLLTDSVELDESRLVGEEELKSRRSREHSMNRQKPPQTVLHRPASVTVAETSRLSSLRYASDQVQTPRSTIGRKPSQMPSASTSNTTPTSFAPWKHTRSDFTGESFTGAALPRFPPPVSGSLVKQTVQPVGDAAGRRSSDRSPGGSGRTNDPLGVAVLP